MPTPDFDPAALLRLDPTGPRIPLILHANMLADRARLDAFAAAVRRHAKPGVRLLDLGSGTGILAALAAEAGAEVVAVEAQRALHALAAALLAPHPTARAIRDDARRFTDDRPFDVVVCEMLDTWLVRETQLQACAHAATLLAPGGVLIPRGTVDRIEPVEADFRFAGIEVPLPCHETADLGRRAAPLGPARIARSFDFRIPAAPERADHGELAIDRPGRLTALRLTTETTVDDGIAHAGSDWLCPPLLLPVVPPRPVAPGDRIAWRVEQTCGLGFRAFRYAV